MVNPAFCVVTWSLSVLSKDRLSPHLSTVVRPFNAVTPQLADRLGIDVQEHAHALAIRLGGGKTAVIPRHLTHLSISLSGFQDYAAVAFVMDVPWLTDTNPQIDWPTRTVAARVRRHSAARAPSSDDKHLQY